MNTEAIDLERRGFIRAIRKTKPHSFFRYIVVATLAITLPTSALGQAQWNILPMSHEDTEEVTRGVTLRHIVFALGDRKRIEGDILTIAPGVYSAKAFTQPAKHEHAWKTLAQICEDSGADCGINGGFFDQKTYKPIGVCVVDGQYLSEIPNEHRLGCVTVDSTGGIDVLWAKDFIKKDISSGKITSLISSGPFIINPGGCEGIKEGDKTYDRRSIIGKAGTELFIFCTTAAYLKDLSNCLYQNRNKLLDLPIDSALNLDGGYRLAFSIKGKDGWKHDVNSTGEGLWSGAPRNGFIFFFKRAPTP